MPDDFNPYHVKAKQLETEHLPLDGMGFAVLKAMFKRDMKSKRRPGPAKDRT